MCFFRCSVMINFVHTVPKIEALKDILGKAMYSHSTRAYDIYENIAISAVRRTCLI